MVMCFCGWELLEQQVGVGGAGCSSRLLPAARAGAGRGATVAAQSPIHPKAQCPGALARRWAVPWNTCNSSRTKQGQDRKEEKGFICVVEMGDRFSCQVWRSCPLRGYPGHGHSADGWSQQQETPALQHLTAPGICLQAGQARRVKWVDEGEAGGQEQTRNFLPLLNSYLQHLGACLVLSPCLTSPHW